MRYKLLLTTSYCQPSISKINIIASPVTTLMPPSYPLRVADPNNWLCRSRVLLAGRRLSRQRVSKCWEACNDESHQDVTSVRIKYLIIERTAGMSSCGKSQPRAQSKASCRKRHGMRERWQALKCALSAQRKSEGDRPRENLSYSCCYRVLITTRRLEACVVVVNGQETASHLYVLDTIKVVKFRVRRVIPKL